MEIEIWACCYSEKVDVSISFGTSVESLDGDLSSLDTEWIFCGMGESFWENHEEFEAGITQAEALQNKDSAQSLRQALFQVFGHFKLSFTVNAEEIKLDINFDADELMYSLLEN